MNVLLTALVSVLATSSLAGQSDGLPTWTNFVGYWRVDPAVTERSPTSPFRLNIRVQGAELTIERHGFGTSETSRYRLDGSSARTIQDGRPVDATAALEGATLVIKSQLMLPDGRRSTVTETYSIRRRITIIMTIDRATTVGSRTTTTSEELLRLPEPRLLHPDNSP